MKKILTIAAMMLVAVSLWAGEVTVVVNPSGLTSAPGTVTPEMSSDKKTCTLTVKPADGYYLTVANLSAVTVIDGGQVQARRRGIDFKSESITITATNPDADPSGETTYTFTMPTDENIGVEVTAEFQQRTNVSGLTIEDIDNQTYSGLEIEPTLTVKNGTTTLTLNTDYTVAYGNNINKGTATATITGIRTYMGTATKNFSITAKTITADMVSLSTNSLIYDGTTKAPTVTVTDGENNLVKDQDYTLSYQEVKGETTTDVTNPTNAGTYNVVVTGKGNYDDTKSASKSFTIGKADLKDVVIAAIDDVTYNGEEQKPTLTVTFNNNAVAAEEYEVSYKKGETTVTEVKDADTYTVVLTSTNKNFAENTKVTKEFKITRATATISADNQSAVYNGSAITFDVSKVTVNPVSISKDNLVFTYSKPDPENPEEDIVYEAGPTDVGEYNVTIGLNNNNYTAEPINKTLTITAKSIANVTITIEAPTSFTYTGNAQVPTSVTVKDGTKDLKVDEDYTISYSDNVNAGDAVLKVTGKGNYDVNTFANKTFTIGKANLKNVVIAAIEDVTYNGEEQKPTLTVTFNNNTVSANEYEVSYKKGETIVNEVKEAGEYTVVLTSKNINFAENTTASQTFKINNRTLEIGTLVTFAENQNWASYYNETESFELPKGYMAYIVTGVSENSATVSAIKYIPKGVAVFIQKGTEETTENTNADGNWLQGTTEDTPVSEIEGTVYGLHDNALMRVTTGTIPAHRAILVTGAPQARHLSLTFENGKTTAIDVFEVDNTTCDDKWYSLDGRMLQGKPTKNGLYIKNGKTVVVNNK